MSDAPTASTTTRRKFTIRKRQNVAAARTMEEPTDLSQISVDVLGGPRPERRVLCDTSFTKRILDTRATLVDIVPSSSRLGEGSYGFTTSADLHVRPSTGASRSEFSCISALKTVKSVDAELSSDIVIEIATYARTKMKPCIAQGLYAKVLPREVKLVMEHYIKDLQKLYDENVIPNFVSFEDNYEQLAKCLMFQILTGLNGLHDENILHRDLKPENVLLAHTGNVFVTDFGLSFHDPFGIEKPRSYYQYDTTPTIKPPEAVDKQPISSTFDLWSAGCCMAFFLTNEHMFDFWKTGSDWASVMRRRNETTQKFTEKRDKLLKLVSGYTNTKTGTDLYTADCVDLLEKLLAINPAARPTAEAALRHPWFKEMTLKQSQKTIQQLFTTSDMTRVATGRPMRTSYIREKTRRVKEAARQRGDPGVPSNTHLSEYTTVLPAITSDTVWKPFHRTAAISLYTKASMFVTALSYITRMPGLPVVAFLHAIELHDRLMNRVQLAGKTYAISFLAGYLHTVLVSPITATSGVLWSFASTDVQALTSNSISSDSLRGSMRSVLRYLNGDLFPQRDGLVEQVVRTLLLRDGVDPAKDHVLIARRLLWFLICYICIDATKRPFAELLELAAFLTTECEKKPESLLTVPANLAAAHTELKSAIADVSLVGRIEVFFGMIVASIPAEAIGSMETLTGISMERIRPHLTSFDAIAKSIKDWMPTLN